MLDWNTPLYFITKGEIFELRLSDFEERAMLPREHGVDFRYFVTDDSEGVWWVMKCVVQGARPIRISHHETEEEAKRVANNYNINLAYDKALEEGCFESEFDAQQFMLENAE